MAINHPPAISQTVKRRKQKPASPGRLVLGTIAAFTAIGGFLADWNKTHIFNPNWPPHAKFHDAMSITLGSFLGTTSLYFLLRKSRDEKQDLQLSVMLPAFFWMSMGTSYVFPGAKGLEAEFPNRVPRIGNFWVSENVAAATMLTLLGIGYSLEHASLAQTKVEER
ncbi:DUF6640 family protein [Planomicrobium okeanokoites]|uniref:DUF6640 family protein n=1 Tax=Planomicrobium okeanokoites TaxID=244 RepID=UPI002490DB95|nr:DUF6640 family protein [Planomicrobium okeanokoites]